MTLLRQKINYYDRMKLMDKKKYPNYVNKSRNKKFNQSVRKILSEESLKTLKIVKKKIEEFQPVPDLYPSNQRRLLTESLDKDKDVTSLAFELGKTIDITDVKEKLKTHFADLFDFEYTK